MILTHFFLDYKNNNSKIILLYRFHIVTIIVNLLAITIDMSSGRTANVWIDAGVVVFLSLNAWYLYIRDDTEKAAYIFLVIVASALFTQIWLNHFGTMSVVFILLLPLTTMLFIRLSSSVIIELIMISIMALLLYIEYRNNPANPIIQNPTALFHLTYATVIIYIFGLLYHFSILKTFEELDASNRQKELLLKEVHHRVKNNLNVIASIIGLQAARLDEEEREHLLKSKVRIESIAMVHEMLYRSDDLNSINFIDYMRRLSGLLQKMYSHQQDVKVDIRSEVEMFPLEVMVQLGILANELLTNSIKYAFGQSGGTIVMEMQDDGVSYHFMYEDDGRGISDIDLLSQGSTLGIKLIHLTARQLGGDVKISSSKGLKYEIRFDHE